MLFSLRSRFDVQIIISQDANEPDIATTYMLSDVGNFNFLGLLVNDIIGSGSGTIGGGFLTATYTVYVDFIIKEYANICQNTKAIRH